jgi:hypothetical protein
MAALREGTARRMTDQDWTPLIISVAPNGARHTRAGHPAISFAAAKRAARALLADAEIGG